MATATTQGRREDSVLMVYESYASAHVAMGALARAGLRMHEVSALGCDGEPEGAGVEPPPGWRARFTGGGWRRVGPRIHRDHGLVVPGLVGLTAMGPLARRVARILDRGVGGGSAGLLREVLSGFGVPDGSVVRCGLAVKNGGVLIVVPASCGEDVA